LCRSNRLVERRKPSDCRIRVQGREDGAWDPFKPVDEDIVTQDAADHQMNRTETIASLEERIAEPNDYNDWGNDWDQIGETFGTIHFAFYFACE
jgi:hypothetical protein